MTQIAYIMPNMVHIATTLGCCSPLTSPLHELQVFLFLVQLHASQMALETAAPAAVAWIVHLPIATVTLTAMKMAIAVLM